MEDHEQQKTGSWQDKVSSRAGCRQISSTSVMEWNMVWKDVLIGFTVAGIISVFLPRDFYTALFFGSASAQAANPGFSAILQQTFIGPVVAFFTFIGSMGNIPLAVVWLAGGVAIGLILQQGKSFLLSHQPLGKN
jgi:uncharacterized membrane protein YraQ (UPF0718 family)